jgi:RHS repeat-associated protein
MKLPSRPLTTRVGGRRRSLRRWQAAGAIVVLAALVTQLCQPIGRASGTGGPGGSSGTANTFTYTYDADGRLATVTNSSGQVAAYHYDKVGNVTSITLGTTASAAHPTARPAKAAKPSIHGVTPTRAPVGGTITITGSGFSPRATFDIVKVGTLMATVERATASELTVAAPPGAGGRVTVETPGGEAMSASSAKVAIAGAPKPVVSDTSGDAHPLRAPQGVTAVAGQVETAHALPLEGVTVSVSTTSWGSPSTTSTVTNRDGQFLISHLSSGTHTLVIDASRLSHGRNYGIYSEPVELRSGRTTVLPWVTYLTPIDTSHAVTIPSPTNRRITLSSPALPGLKVIIPAGTVIRNYHGDVVRSLSLTALPTQRTPMPWGPSMVPRYFTVQPGDATVSGPGLEVIYPNTSRRPAGEAVSYLAESPAWPGTGWYSYGEGHVSANGKEIIPSASTRYHSTDPGGYSTKPKPGSGSAPGSNCPCGDPVDLTTGLLESQSTDISLNDIDSVSLTRSFRQLDDTVRDFGIGGSSSLNLYVVATGSGDFDLVQPDGGVVQYHPTSTTGVYQAANTATQYAGSTMLWTSGDPDGPFTVTLADGSKMTFANPAYLTSVTDPYGNTIDINRVDEYTGNPDAGQIATVTTPSGRWLEFTYGSCGSQTNGVECVSKVVDNSGRTLSYQYDEYGRLTAAVDLNGGTTRYGWAACTNSITCTEMTSVTDPMGRVTTISYGAAGRVTRQVQPNGGVWTYAYSVNSGGAITGTVVTDPDGHKTAATFNSSGYETSNTTGYGTAAAEKTTSTYEPGTGLRVSFTDALGRKTTYTYDSLGDPLTVTNLAGTANAATTRYTYDSADGLVTSTTNALGQKTTFVYDKSAGTETITTPLGDRTVETFNSLGQIVSVENPGGGITYYSYVNGVLAAIADPLGNVTTIYNNSEGLPAQVTDPGGAATTYSYDNEGNVLSSTGPLGDKTSVTYNADNEPTSVTDANGHVTTFAYNVMGETIAQTDPLGHSQRWTYDLVGNPVSRTDPDGNVTDYSYDSVGRLTGIRFGVSGSSSYETDTVTYDAGNRPLTVVDSRTGTYKRSYDGLNDVTAVSSPQGTIDYTYNSIGEETGMQVSGQNAVSYTWNANGDLTGAVQGTAKTTYAYGANGLPVQTVLPNGVIQKDTFDAQGLITAMTDSYSGATIGSASFSYNSDEQISSVTGSLAAQQLPAAVSSETYNADNELTAIGSTTLGYDAAGNLTTDGAETYTWNPLGQLSSAKSPAGTYTYTYDPVGQQVTATTGSTTTSSLYDGSALVQQSVSGTPTAEYLTVPTGSTVQVHNSAGTVVPLVNGLGSTTALTTSAGKIATTYQYTPSGVATTSGTPNPDPEQFATGETQAAGLESMGARYYNPASGRFVSQDPAGFGGGSPDLYQYAGADPVNYNDPSGLGSCPNGVAIFWGLCLDNPFNLSQDAQNFDQNSQIVDNTPVVGFLLQSDPFYDTFRDGIYAAQGCAVSPAEWLSDGLSFATTFVPFLAPGKIMSMLGLGLGKKTLANFAIRLFIKLGGGEFGERVGFYMISHIWPESELTTLLSNLATQPATAKATSNGCQC